MDASSCHLICLFMHACSLVVFLETCRVDAVQQALVAFTSIAVSDQIVMCHGARLDPAKPLSAYKLPVVSAPALCVSKHAGYFTLFVIFVAFLGAFEFLKVVMSSRCLCCSTASPVMACMCLQLPSAPVWQLIQHFRVMRECSCSCLAVLSSCSSS